MSLLFLPKIQFFSSQISQNVTISLGLIAQRKDNAVVVAITRHNSVVGDKGEGGCGKDQNETKIIT